MTEPNAPRPHAADDRSVAMRLCLLAAGAATSAVLLGLAFPPAEFDLLAWCGLVPLLLALAAVRRVGSGGWIIVTLAGVGFGTAGFIWLRHIFPLIPLLLGVYLGLYWLLFAATVRWLSMGRGVPLALAAPLAWAGLEAIRNVFGTGVPYLMLGHTQYRQLLVIQIADIAGSAGVAFWLVAVNGAIADVILYFGRGRWAPKKGPLLTGLAAVFIITVGSQIYGGYRLATLRLRRGPRVALIQANIPQDAKNRATLETSAAMFEKHLDLSERAATSTPPPDLILWPETMAPPYEFDLVRGVRRGLLYGPEELAKLQPEAAAVRVRLLKSHRRLDRLQKRVAVCIGAISVPNPDREVYYNSAFMLRKGERGPYTRYDKMHLVPFGEYIPFRDLLGWIIDKVAPGALLSPGTEPLLFAVTFQRSDGSTETWRFAPTICFDDAFSELVAEFGRGGRRMDFIANLTNEGWYRDGAELDHHLAIGVFRAVECRVGLARAANTGISAIIAPNGRIVSTLKVEGRDREVAGVLTGHAFTAEGRSPFYAVGETFGRICAAGWFLCVTLAVISGIRARRAHRPAAVREPGGPSVHSGPPPRSGSKPGRTPESEA
jgi:apolipoprotein N-acyltransferase